MTDRQCESAKSSRLSERFKTGLSAGRNFIPGPFSERGCVEVQPQQARTIQKCEFARHECIAAAGLRHSRAPGACAKVAPLSARTLKLLCNLASSGQPVFMSPDEAEQERITTTRRGSPAWPASIPTRRPTPFPAPRRPRRGPVPPSGDSPAPAEAGSAHAPSETPAEPMEQESARTR